MTDPTPTRDAQALDQFIASNAPDWLKNASADELQDLRASLASHHRLQARVSELLAQIQAPEAFALPRLREALGDFGCASQPRQALWREIRLHVEMPVFRITDVDLPSFRRYPQDSDLLPRLLQNFNEDEARASYYYPGAGIVEDGQLLPCAPAQVAARCRALDLGGRYQTHLDRVLTPNDATRSQAILDLLRDDKRAALDAHARCGYLKGYIDVFAQRLLLDLAAGKPLPAGVSVARLQLLGFEVPGALLLELSADGRFKGEPSMAGQALLYLPSDANRPVRQGATLDLLNDELATDLRYPQYADFITRQLHADDRLSFLGKLQASLLDTRPDLEPRSQLIDTPPFDWLAQQQIARIKADAALLMVPTATVDQALHRQRMEALKSLGLNVAGILVSFIPGVGELMLLGLVKDLLSEVYEGVVDWNHGQREEALDHLLGVLGNVALSALVAAGSTAVVRQLQRSTFVDGLLPVAHGGRRLWSAQRASHHLPLELPGSVDGDGLLRAEGRHWWRFGEQLVEVRQTAADGRWRIVHPSRPEAWTPELEGNGDGAWWQVGEDPLQWQGSAWLMRRLGPRSHGLSNAACEQVATICGYDEARLRGLLVERRAMPVALVHVLADFRLDARLGSFFEALEQGSALDAELCTAARELRPQATGDETALWKADAQALRPALFDLLIQRSAPVVDPLAAPLQRLFPSLPARFVQSLLEDAAPLGADGRVPLALQEKAHEVSREVRILHALEGLYLTARCGNDTVRMVFSLFRHLPQWPRGLSFELREEGFDGPVLERVLPLLETREVRVLVGGRGRFRTFDSAGVALAEAHGDLFEALLAGFSSEHRTTLGCADATALRTLLREQASGDRERLPGLLGISPLPAWFRAPQRLVDGRLGYPLSGRGRPGSTTLTGLVRTLYPGFSELEASVWLDQIQQLNGDPMGELLRAQESLRTLDEVLTRWLMEINILVRSGRRRVADEIRRCWCRQTPPVRDVDGQIIGYRLRLERSSGGELPALPSAVDFSHVVDLVLSGSGQSDRVNAFLQGFPRLRWLDLGVNDCTGLPAALANMPDLQELYLDGNHIHLTEQGQNALSALSRLEVLNLDRNPLGWAPDISALPRLRRLSMRGAGLTSLPPGLVNRPFLELADLRGNQMVTLPEAFFQAPPRIRSATVVFGNPLDQATRGRLWEASVEDGLLEDGADPDGVREQWLAGMRDDLLRVRSGQWLDLYAEPGSQGFFRLLGNLLDTAEYRLAPGHLQERVWQMIAAAVENTALRESLFELASAPTTCVDSVSSSFSVLDVRLQVSQAAARVPDDDHGSALLALARRLFRLDRLERHALQVINQRRLINGEVDEVEISLALRVRLAEPLELPGQPRHMQFGDIAAVSETDLLHARQQVEAAEAGAELSEFIARQDFWLEHLRAQHGADFRRIEAQFWERLETLCEQQEQLAEGDYLQRMNQLGSDREKALHEQARTLTEQALQAVAEP